MTSGERSSQIAQQRRILALEWEANCERLACALGTVPRPDGSPPIDLLGAIHRAHELLDQLDQLEQLEQVRSVVPDGGVDGGSVLPIP